MIDLNQYYIDAKKALDEKNYDLAADYLRQILLEDHDFKDASRLLAQAIKRKRRHWYNDLRLWIVAGIFLFAIISIWFVPRFMIPNFPQENQPPVLPALTEIKTKQTTPTPNSSLSQTATIMPTTTEEPLPLSWKRIVLGKQFPYDSVVSILTDSNDRDVIYAGMRNAGIYKSINGGISWISLSTNLANSKIENMAINPSDPQTIYAGTEMGTFVSNDGGTSWRYIFDGNKTVVDPYDTDHLILFDWVTFYQSFDGGYTWSPEDFPTNTDPICPRTLGGYGAFLIDPLDSNHWMTPSHSETDQCPNGIYQTFDAGKTWENIAFIDQHINKLLYSMVGKDRYSIFATIGPDFWISFDNGMSWEKQDFFVQNNLITVNHDNPGIAYVYGMDNFIYRTKDGGYHWSIINEDTPIVGLTNLYSDTQNDVQRLIAGQNGLILSIDAGVTWSEINNGLGSKRLELKVDPSDTSRLYVAAYSHNNEQDCKLYRSDDLGETWKPILESGWFSNCGPLFDNKNNLFAVRNGQIVKSADHGNTWNELTQPDARITSVSINPEKSNTIYAMVENDVPSIYYSEDGGLNWEPASGFDIDNFLLDGQVFYSKDEQIIYSTSMWWKFRSQDRGKTWENCQSIHSSNNTDTELIVDPNNANRLILASVGKGILISTDGCKSWQPSNAGFDSINVNSVVLDPNDDNTIYAGATGGAYVSYDSGLNWHKINDGLLGATVIYSIAVDKDSNVYAATPYGIFKLEKK